MEKWNQRLYEDIRCYDGSMHSVDSNEAAFKTAARMAFKNAFLDANPQLLEPVYEITVTVPANYMGDVMSDLHAVDKFRGWMQKVLFSK